MSGVPTRSWTMSTHWAVKDVLLVPASSSLFISLVESGQGGFDVRGTGEESFDLGKMRLLDGGVRPALIHEGNGGSGLLSLRYLSDRGVYGEGGVRDGGQ